MESSFSLRDINETEPRDTYNDKIKVFRKDGSAMLIDKGATVLDFAFYIHSELGYHFAYAMVDESRTQLPAYTRLNAGDRITIVTREDISPDITWFKYVKTSKAVHHLVRYFQGRIN
jgi:(p)ppGpp synthase/HD superfamily hydrolase